ncbi:MAG: endonuclease [Rhodothermia bacterium]|nr:endonuclease [Rhodothermia bacterium]
MNKPYKHLLTFLCVLFPLISSAQNRPMLQVDVTALDLGDCTFDTVCTKTFTLLNPGAESVTVEKISIYDTHFSATPVTPFTVAASGNQIITVSFSSPDNLTYKDVLTVEAQNGVEVVEVALSARAVYNEDYGSKTDYYLSTQDLWGEALKTALNNIIKNNTNNSYDTSRNAMFGITIDAINNGNNTKTLECIYTGRLVTMSTSTQRPSASSPEYINTEHTWPQSFFNQNNPMVSDIHHLYPTDVDANNERANFPFGNVNRTGSGVRCHDKDIPSQNGTCTNAGSGEWSYLLSNVYEPRDVQKGNTARSLFYFMVRYGNLGGFFTSTQETALRQWHTNDPPDAKEKARNTGIMNFQNNRNPFVDHPEFANRISSFYGTATGVPSSVLATAVPTAEDYGEIGLTQTLEAEINVINRGNAAFTYTTSLSGTGFSIVSGSSGSVPAYGYTPIRVRFAPSTISSYNGILSISPSSGSTLNVSLAGTGNSATSREEERTQPAVFVVEKPFPNPFTTTSTLRFATGKSAQVVLTLHDVLGRTVQTVLNEQVADGQHEVALQANGLPAGVYIYRLSVNGQSHTGKIIKQ